MKPSDLDIARMCAIVMVVISIAVAFILVRIRP